MTDFRNLSYIGQRCYQLKCQILKIWHFFSIFNTMKIDYYTSFYSGQYYHIYNRGNNNEKIFYEPDNYYFFSVIQKQLISKKEGLVAFFRKDLNARL